MLQSLYVRNFALIEEANIEFSNGFNVFTGETGAGKSILIDAFGIALGARASSDYIRRGEDSFFVQAAFDISDVPEAQAILNEQDIEFENELFLRRRVSLNGKNQIFANGVQIPLSVLKNLGSALADIHGQHENQKLLQAQAPLLLTDLYGADEITPVCNDYKNIYSEYKALEEEVKRLNEAGRDRERLLDRLEWELNEINDAELKENELEELQEEWKFLQNNTKVMNAVNEACELLDGRYSVLNALAQAKDKISGILRYDKRLQDCADSLESSWLAADECRHDLAEYLSSREFDGERAFTVEKRLDLLYKIYKKYGNTYAEIQDYAEKIQSQYDELKNLEKALSRSEAKQKELYTAALGLANTLSALRKKYSEKLSAEITSHIKDLSMPQGELKITFATKDELTVNGLDDMTFIFSANAGEELKPLQKVASGGELSRVALAVKTVLFDAQNLPTMIFDEIDTGIGGLTAKKVAEKMILIASKGQVLCITHLPQIACFADNHISILKVDSDDRTHTELKTLNTEARIDELVRMSGNDITNKAARLTAEELLDSADKIKQNSLVV